MKNKKVLQRPCLDINDGISLCLKTLQGFWIFI